MPFAWSTLDVTRRGGGGTHGWYVGSMPSMPQPDDLRIALIGCGRQGLALTRELAVMPGVRFVAVCDLLRVDRAEPAARYLRHVGHDPRIVDDVAALCARPQGIDAVIIATPDRQHASQAVACLEAGLHVYLEPPMACDQAGIDALLAAEQRTGRKVQIGYQRRSNPRYWHAVEILMRQEQLLGRVNHGRAVWNMVDAWDDGRRLRGVAQDRLVASGFASLEELVNWRHFRKHTGGPFLTWGAHQLDLFCWLHGNPPLAVTATGGCDQSMQGDAWDTASASFEFLSGTERNRLLLEVTTWRMGWGVIEEFMGLEGALVISEQQLFPDRIQRQVARSYPGNNDEERWMEMAKRGLIHLEEQRYDDAKRLLERERERTLQRQAIQQRMVDVRGGDLSDHYGLLVAESEGLVRYKLPMDCDDKLALPHLMDFCAAIRLDRPVRCPPSVAAWATIGAIVATKAAVDGRRTMVTEPLPLF